MKRHSILIISPQVYPQPFSGTGMRAHFQAVHLSRQFEVTVVSESGVYKVRDGEFDSQNRSAVAESHQLSAYLKSIIWKRHYGFEKYRCSKWEIPELKRFVSIIVHYPALLEILPSAKIAGCKIIFDTHNNEREYFETVAKQTGNPIKRFAMRQQIQIAEELVRRKANNISATISVSESDRDWVTELCRPDISHLVVPNNLFQFNPTQWTGKNALLYIGSLDVSMNLQALKWFRTNVWPAIRMQIPGIQMIVAGRNPSASLTRSLESEGMEVVPNPSTLDTLYSQVRLSVVPALSGSGGKIKVCESLARAVPCSDNGALA